MITILMAVYNGEKYLTDQIESILAQTVGEWKLVIQDDCSSDNTVCIARRYADRYPDKIVILQRDMPSGSAKANFFSMIEYADTDYIMTCDQDDIWFPDKIEITLKKMLELEKKVGVDLPVLVHTDLMVVDSHMNVLCKSLFKYENLDKRKDKLNNLLIQNIVTGCTVMANRVLIEKINSNKEPDNAIMHDWWFALIAAAFGCLGFVDVPTVKYRQHRNNEVGAKEIRSLSYIVNKAGLVIHSPLSVKSLLSATYAQAECFIDIFKNELTDDKLRILSAYASIAHSSKTKRLKIISKYNFWKNGALRKIGQILLT